MKIETTDFARMVSACARIADDRHAMPAYRTIRLEAVDGILTAMASNGEYWLTLRAPCDGDLPVTLAPASKLDETVSKLTAETLDVSVEDGALHIKAKGSKRRMQVMAGDSFPVVPDVQAAPIPLDVARAAECFAFCLPFASTDDKTQAYLCGVHLVVREGKLYFAASDGNAVAECEYGEAAGDASATVPTGFASEFAKLPIMGDASLLIGEQKVALTWPGGSLIAPRITLAFPDYRRAVPSGELASITAKADDVSRGASGVRGFGASVGKFGSVIAITPSDSSIEMRSYSSEGEAIDDIDATITGDMPVFGVSSAYLERAMKGFAGVDVRIAMEAEAKPLLITSDERSDRLAVVMPRRI